MALSCKVGTFNTTTGTSNIAVSGLGFQPKIVIFLGAPETVEATAAHATMSMGWATSSTQRGCVLYHSRDAQATTGTGSSCHNDACFGLRLADNSGFDGLLDFVSMDADGFTVVPDNAFATSFLVGYIALGGDSITNQIAGSFTAPTTSGTFDVTDAGFQPTSLLLLCASRGNTSFGVNGSPAGFCLGVTDGTASRTVAWFSTNGAAVATTGAIIRNDSILNAVTDGATDNRYTFDSFLVNGFRLNKVNGTAGHVGLYLAIAGASVKVSDFDVRDTTGAISVSGVGFQPAGLLSAMYAHTDVFQTSLGTHIRNPVGFTDGTGEFCVSVGERDAADPTITSRRLSTSAILSDHNNVEPHNLATETSFTSFGSDGYDLNTDTANGFAAQAFGVAFGPADTGGGGGSTTIMRRRRDG